MIDQIGSSGFAPHVPAHVQRFVFLEAEPATAHLQLVLGQADVQQYTLHRCDPEPGQVFGKMDEVSMEEMDVVRKRCQDAPGIVDGIRILIDTDQKPVGHDLLANGPGMSGTPQRAVDVGASGPAG